MMDKKPVKEIKIKLKDLSKLLDPNVQRKKQKIDEQRRKNTERHRRFRAKLSEEKKAEIRAKERERNRKRRETGLLKTINDMTEQEKAAQRKRWRESQSRYRDRQLAKNQRDPLEINEEDMNNSINDTCPVKKGPKKKRGKKDVHTKLREATARIATLRKEKRTLQRSVARMKVKIEKLEKWKYSKKLKSKTES